MTLDEAIEHCLKVAEQEEWFINYPHSDIVLDDLNIESRKRFVAEHRQLAEWLTDYKEAKRLLKAAVEDFSNMNDRIFDCDGMCDTCPIHDRDECDKWRYADEALALIGEDTNATAREDGVTEGKVNEQNIEVSRPDGNCLYCKFQYSEDSDYWCSICPGNPEDI